jgi:lipid II:glycine glycyltransferase (peptidoglycan interpeptide bridge formation enzyme)
LIEGIILVGKMKIVKSSPELAQSSDQYLLCKDVSLFYYSSKYMNFIKELLGCEDEYLLAMEGDGIRGILPLMYIHVDPWLVYNSLPYYGSNGGIIADNQKAYGHLLNAYNEIAYSKNTLSSTIITNPLIDRNAGDIVHNYIDYRIGQMTRLSGRAGEREGLLERLESSARRNIKKALREGVTVEVDNNQLQRLCEIHQENIQAIGGIPKSNEFFRLIPQYFVPDKDFNLYVAKRDGVVIAGLLVFYFSKTVEYFTPAIDSDYRSIQPLSHIIITAMSEAAKRGFEWWNWGGTWPNQVGVYRFKRKWGAGDRKYWYYTQLNDLSILRWPKDRILKTFPNFFIVPFSALSTRG